MSVRVNLNDLLSALEWVSAGDAAAVECSACVSRLSGAVVWVGEGVDDEVPDDIDDASLYVAVPHKSDFELGRSLALRFVEELLPASFETVHGYFRKRGAYSRFKALLERSGQLDAWHRFEERAIEDALRTWCHENGLTPVNDPPDPHPLP